MNIGLCFSFLENFDYWNIVDLLKSDNLQYNTLVRWFAGTNDSSTKRLMFPVYCRLSDFYLFPERNHPMSWVLWWRAVRKKFTKQQNLFKTDLEHISRKNLNLICWWTTWMEDHWIYRNCTITSRCQFRASLINLQLGKFGVKGQIISKANCQAMNSYKNEQMNSFLLLCDLSLFVFWKKYKSTKRNFEINDL